MNPTSKCKHRCVDAHHHLWDYNPLDYRWITDAMSILRRDFLPDDLKPELDRVGIESTVVVQARQKIEETEWLLKLATQYPFILGVVGWVPLTDPQVVDILEYFADSPKLKGVRHLLQDEPDENYMLRKDFNRGIDALTQFGLTYDILIFAHQLPQTIRFVDRHPDQVFILDHIAKPRIRDNVLSPWAEDISELARRENVYCKISGMVTEADWTHWSEEQLAPYLEIVLEAFSPCRLMFGSDWPVCLIASSYQCWFQVVTQAISQLNSEEQSMILGGTAARVYRLQEEKT